VSGKSYLWDEDHPVLEVTANPWACPVIHPGRGWWKMLATEVPEQHVAAVDGSDLLVRTSVLKQLGGFDDAFFAFYEEGDLCARVLALGYEIVFIPSMESWHRRGHSAQRIPFKTVYLAQRNRLTFIAKHWPNSRWLVLAVSVSIEYLLRGLLGRTTLRPNNDPPDELAVRLPVFLAGLWGLLHLGTLRARRKRTEQSGQHDEHYIDRLAEIYSVPPFAPYLSSYLKSHPIGEVS
jgi:GT2 family glycosyltransferase